MAFHIKPELVTNSSLIPSAVLTVPSTLIKDSNQACTRSDARWSTTLIHANRTASTADEDQRKPDLNPGITNPEIEVQSTRPSMVRSVSRQNS